MGELAADTALTTLFGAVLAVVAVLAGSAVLTTCAATRFRGLGELVGGRSSDQEKGDKAKK